MAPTGLWKPKLEFSIYALVGHVLQAELANGRVAGKSGKARALGLFPQLVEDFLNWRNDDESILRFTKLYGPLAVASEVVSTQKPRDVSWTFGVDEWREFQAGQRRHWVFAARYPAKTVMFQLGNDYLMTFEKDESRLSLQIGSLSKFLEMSIDALPAERIKKCQCPESEGCVTPYFVAQHLNQSYCSDRCANWSQKAIKREWWRQQAALKKGDKKK